MGQQRWPGLGPTKLRIHNSFIWPYLHILLLLLLLWPLDGPLRRKKRAEIGIWLAFVANILALHFVLPLCAQWRGRGAEEGSGAESLKLPTAGGLAKAFIKFKSCYRRK